MKRTTAPGNDGNRYTEGNPTLGIPATTVGGDEMNNIQEEIANVVEGAGIALDQTGATEDQMLTAILSLISTGGTQGSIAIDNAAGPLDVTGLVFNSANITAARVLYHLERRTDSQDLMERGEMFIGFNNETNQWEIQTQSFGDDAEVVFSITAAGQVQYTSVNIVGTTYSGTLRWTDITTVAQ